MNRTSPIKKERLTASDRVGYALATGMGAGFVPIAPGTVGALEGVAIYLAIHALHLQQVSSLIVLAIINVVLFAAGVWASNRTCEITGVKDPRSIVIDEVSGQLIALTPLVILPSFSIRAVVIGFLLFRLFDIYKPYPIRRLERLDGGLGVMADDALAGVYAAVALWLSHLVGVA
ncbi:MAG TPA: phosphatidylglycerophosphatase A [Blastocatellia bacterium]|nr:phosphatidylglycerophosphatase A [Blastocatellia bacterium]